MTMRNIIPAVFLACSWFWCIGGFFPVLLERDFGRIALLFFILFNVIGAALFGLVWRNQTRMMFLDRMRVAARAFSALVVGYHVVFMVWISVLQGSPVPIIGFALMTLVFTIFRARLSGIAVAVFALTIMLFAIAVISPVPEETAKTIREPFLHQILPLALGFLLAPYFDLTFHRAFADSDNPRVSFLLGLGVMFSALLAGMVFAAPAFNALLNAAPQARPAIMAVIALLVLQTGFTAAAHLRELAGTAWLSAPVLPIVLAGLVGTGSLHVIAGMMSADMAMTIGELIYRGFVFIIGVAFPVILLFGGFNRHALAVIAFMTPCYGLGFLIGGDLAPFLSVGIAGLAVTYLVRRHPRLIMFRGKDA